MGFVTDQERALTHLLVSMMNASEQQGARVSRILHDEIGQVLSAIGLQLDLLRMDLQDGADTAPQRISDIQNVLERAMSHVRDLSYDLNPSVVERAGLQFAVDRLVGRYRHNFPGSIRLLFDSSIRLPLDIGTAFYKICEQALENALQHAHCSVIEVQVKPWKHGVAIEVRDNGTGFVVDESRGGSHGLGLYLMRHHAEQAELRFSITSAPEQGTIVKAVYRVKAHEDNPTAGESGPVVQYPGNMRQS